MNEKIQIDIYKGLPMILGKVKSVALSAVIGKSNSWINNKINRYVLKGKVAGFVESDLMLINNALELLGEEMPEETPHVEKEVLNEELDELFSVLMGKQEDEQEQQPQLELEPEPVIVEENVVLQTQDIAPKEEIVIPDEIIEVENISEEKTGEESIKGKLRQNPKEAVLLSEILTPKFKQYN